MAINTRAALSTDCNAFQSTSINGWRNIPINQFDCYSVWITVVVDAPRVAAETKKLAAPTLASKLTIG